MSPVTFPHHSASLGERTSVARSGDDVVRVKVVAGPFPATLVVRSKPTQLAGFAQCKNPQGLLLPRDSQLDNATR